MPKSTKNSRKSTSNSHRSTSSSRRNSTKTTAHTSTAPSELQQTQTELRKINAELTESKRTVRELQAALTRAEELTAIYQKTAPRCFPPLLKVSKQRSRAARDEVTLVPFLADWQCGLQVDPGEVQELNAYNYATMVQRLEKFTDTIIEWAQLHARAYKIREVVCLGLGDLLDGYLRDEQLISLEFPPPVQAIKAGQALGSLLNELSVIAPVRYEGLNTDNHSRLFKKPIMHGRGWWSYNPIMHEIARSSVRDNKHVRVVDYNNIRQDVTIHGHTFILEHGNDIQTWMNLPMYQIFRRVAENSGQRAACGLGSAAYYCYGHWHQFFRADRIIVAPALCGTTPFDHAKNRVSKPGQYVALVGTHGIFDEMVVDL